MTGLPYVAENIKTLLKWSALTAAGIFSIWLLWLVFSFGYKLIFPPPPEPPNTAFGKIRQPVAFNSTFGPELFTLDTAGNQVAIPPRVTTVYEIPAIEGEFASLDNAKKIARGGGLDSEAQQLSDNEWRFTNKKNPNKSLKFNIVTNNFTYKYDWNADSKALEGVFKTDDQAIVTKAKGFLNSFKSLRTDLKDGSTKISFFKIVGNDRNSVGSYSEANAVMVEFFRSPITKDNTFVETDHSRSQVNVWISPAASSEKQLLELNFTYYAYNLEKTATYPPKTGIQAFEDLKTGKAYVAVGGNENFESITITKTSLAYLNPNTDQRTLQQIYIFEGIGEVKGEQKPFIAYVPTITQEYLR